MKKLLLLIIIHYSLLIVNCFPQSITWQKWYDGPLHLDDFAEDICATTDGNFVVVGGSMNANYKYGIYVLKLNPYGDTIWTRLFGNYGVGRWAYSVAPSSDGGCVLTGNADTAFAIKLNSSGNIVWYNRYGGRYVQCYKIIQTRDGGYIACGDETNVNTDGYLLKIDSAGNRQWQRVYSSLYWMSFQSITEGIDNGYVISGFVQDQPYPQDTGKAYVLKTDSLGNIMWSARFKGIGGTTAISIDKAASSYVIGGRTYYDSSGRNIPYRFFIKVGLNGALQKYILFPNVHPNEILTAFKVINDDKYAMTSVYDTALFPPSSPCHLNIIDSSGNVLVDKIIFNGFQDSFFTIYPYINGDIFWVGQSRLPLQGWHDVYVVRSDSSINFPPIGIINNEGIIPTFSKIDKIYPNPFNPVTFLHFQISRAENVKIIIYDVTGKQVAVLFDDFIKPGEYKIKWDASNFSSGIYFAVLIEGNKYSFSQKLILIK